MTTMTAPSAEKPADLSLARRATDPMEKLRCAADAIHAAKRQMRPRELRRNAAAIIVFRQHQNDPTPMQPAAMWRDTIKVSRSLWHKIADEADPERLAELRAELAEKEAEIADLPTERAAELITLGREREKLRRKVCRHAAQVQAVETLQAEVEADPEVGRRLLAIAREEAVEVRRLEALIPEATRLRDEVIAPMLNGTYRQPDGRVIPNAEIARIAKLSTARVAQLRDTRIVA